MQVQIRISRFRINEVRITEVLLYTDCNHKIVQDYAYSLKNTSVDMEGYIYSAYLSMWLSVSVTVAMNDIMSAVSHDTDSWHMVLICLSTLF